MDPRKHTLRHIILTLPKMKQKERILKAAREKDTVTHKENKTYRQEGAGKKYSKS